VSGRRAKGEGSAYRRGDGRWVAELDLGYETGKRVRKTFYGATQAAVLQKMNTAKRNIEVGRSPTATNISLGEYLTAWLSNTVEPSTLRASTKASYRYIVQDHITPTLGAILLEKLKPADIQRLMKEKHESGFSDRTRQLIHATLRKALQDATHQEIVHRNVAAVTKAPKPHRDREKVHALTLPQVKSLFQASEHTRLNALWLMLTVMGLRKGEALALRWTDLDLTTGTLRVERTLSRVMGQGLTFGPTKSSYSERGSFIPPLVLSALQKHWVLQETERLAAGADWTDQGLVFPTATGHPIEPSNLNRQFSTLCKRAGIGHERVHNLRHTAATLLRAYAGADLQDIKEILGHSSISVTVDLYGHPVPELQRALMQKVSGIFEPPDGQAVK
jgi:integrase